MDFKGGEVIEQLKNYVERLSASTNQASSLTIDVWHFVKTDSNNTQVRMAIYTDHDGFVWNDTTEDLRDLGKAIDDYINGNSENG